MENQWIRIQRAKLGIPTDDLPENTGKASPAFDENSMWAAWDGLTL